MHPRCHLQFKCWLFCFMVVRILMGKSLFAVPPLQVFPLSYFTVRLIYMIVCRICRICTADTKPFACKQKQSHKGFQVVSGSDRGQIPVEAWGLRPGWLSGPHAWLAGPMAWLAGPQAWLNGKEGGWTDERAYRKSPHSTGLNPLSGPLPKSLWGLCLKAMLLCFPLGYPLRYLIV